MRSRRTPHGELAEVSRRRLELLSAELAGVRASMAPAEATVEPADQSPPRSSEAARPDAAMPAPAAAPPSAAAPVAARGRHALRPVAGPARLTGWIHDRLPPTLQGRLALTSAHLSIVAVLVAAAFAVSAWWVLRADGGETLVPSSGPVAATRTPSGGLPAPEAAPASAGVVGAAAPASAGEAPVQVVVDVAGKVRRPGIVTLPAGSRVVDALKAAGGPRSGVDLTPLNLARVLVDGEQIVVGAAAPAGVAAAAASSGAAGAAGPLVNINIADQAALEELPGVGPVTAASILTWRTEHGPFTAVDELLEVSGIGEATLAEMAPFVTL